MLAELADYRANPTVSIVAIPVIAQYGITAYLAQLKSAYPQIQFTSGRARSLGYLARAR